MKPVSEILNLEIVENLPTSDSMAATSARVAELEQLETLLDFQQRNVSYEELQGLLDNCSGMIFNGTQQLTIQDKLKKLKPSTNIVMTATEFI